MGDVRMVNEIIRERILLWQEKRQFSQQEAADRIGITKGRFQKWIYGENRIPVDDLPKIAMAFGCSIEDLLGLSEWDHPDWREIGEELTEEQRSSIIQAIKAFKGKGGKSLALFLNASIAIVTLTQVLSHV